MYITSDFDSGNIEVINAESSPVQLAIRKDNNSDFYQWFHFRLEGEAGNSYPLRIVNAGKSAYPEGWENYRVCASYDRHNWFRIPAEYNGESLDFTVDLDRPAIYLAYFAPFSWERHLDLLAWAQLDDRVQLETLGKTLDGRDMSLLTVGDAKTAKHRVWMIARQHPGETMAEWFVEGFLEALLDDANASAQALLRDTVFYIVPNMNPDGSVRGHLRTNAAGANLNREWQDPSMERSPEVYLVREKMLAVGGDLFLDIHGDEALPFNFVAACEGIPGYNERHAMLEETFKRAFVAASPDFQTERGYGTSNPGCANMTVATNWLGHQFRTLALTLEMPFKDNDNLPDPVEGWSPARCKQLARDIFFPIRETLKVL
ncbi:M14 family metallopeptidase [Microbulbifer thermotolerans]|uniref:M14 family metallopeptidase n=1 Tax=Microbulbifer thermotolerans TaxID=252514 RepID=UPI0022494767|nr:M14-type cytosolic carboxypeptidase [Microbulbifer thermotolerans]MCX2831689.1 M14-type cytosolic carboxypeptidase [Microbulbifer thermotolerans]WKT59238.1 M14-type cytosolic carboxypeptidase [Microbulbifer thermotolerans]